jgi:succinoglycan biosynthesis protein ExoW
MSVLSQGDLPKCRVIVVDDGSPLPAEQEIGDLLPAYPSLRIVQQPNAGPGAARNRGLELVKPDTEIVAFIDSDDCWEEGYLAAALEGLGQGCDLFFANSRRFGAEGTRFDWSHSSGRHLHPEAHTAIDLERGLYRFEGDFFDFAVHRSGIISTSTLAYRYASHPQLRFNAQLYNGQDRFFKLQLAKVARRVAFSTRVCAVEGQGINIFDSSKWGSEKSLNLLFNYIRLSRMILEKIELSPPQRDFVRAQLAQSRQDLAGTVLHLLRSGTPIQPGLLRRTFAADPASAVMFLPNLVRAGWRKLASNA